MNDDLAVAQDHIAEVRRLLREPSPRNIDLCTGHLAAALQRCEACRVVIEMSPSKALAPALASFRKELGEAVALLDKAGALYSGLMHSLIAESQADTPVVRYGGGGLQMDI